MRLIDADALWKDITTHIDECTDILEIIDRQPTVEPMQKKERWMKVHGFCTPGGDPVWECSGCGKGRHVYGIEAPTYQGDVSDYQWVACPNCGAEMEG